MSATLAPGPRTRMLLEAPVVPTLLRMAWPNVLVMFVQASTGLIETFYVSRLGTDALAGMALVFPGVMLMQMMSGGAIGGGISSAIARALGAGRQHDADTFVLHALAINVVFGILFTVLLLAFGPALYRALGGEGASLRAALDYSNVVFGSMVLLWIMNGFASVVRGTGNMLVPALITVAGVVVLVPLSPCLIFGLGPFPRLGVAGAGWAIAVFYVGSAAVLGWYVLAGRSAVRLRWDWPHWAPVRAILAVGLVATISSVQTNLVVALTTALVGRYAGSDAVAGYGVGSRLEYLLIPLVFGLGAPLVALVGTNVGAGQPARAMRIAWTGAFIAGALCEAIGLAAAIWPEAWLHLFGSDPAMLSTGRDYLRAVGPFYGFFGFGLALYFASQGAGRLFWPLMAGLVRVVIAAGAGWASLAFTGSMPVLFASVGLALAAYGVLIGIAVRAGVWFRPAQA